MEHDVFISHASEDKKGFVAPLAKLLVELGLNVWYDELSLKVGDSLSRSIDQGLAKSRYGIVVLSKNFIVKPWTEYELRGLVSKELGRDKVILPIWYKVSREEILEFSPPLADKMALSTEKMTRQQIAVAIVQVVRPDIFKNLQLIAWWRRMREEGETKIVSREKLSRGPVRHKSFSADFLIRVKLVEHILAETGAVSYEKLVDGFRRDLTPYNELQIWEKITAAYIDVNSRMKVEGRAKREVLSTLLSLSLGMSPSKSGEPLKHLSYGEAIAITESFVKISQTEDAGPTDLDEE